MAPPKAKKQKLASDPSIIFTLGGAKPDVRLRVFTQEFHANSGILKIHSEYFRKFLEPSGGVQPASASPLFHSDWYTQVEKDGTWVLASYPKFKDSDTSHFVGDVAQEERSFHNLLCAMFNQEYSITDSDELKSMTVLADCYRALPILSNTITGTFYSSPGLINSIRTNPCSVLVSAYKLRHKLLFRESFIHVLGPWSNPRYKQLPEEQQDLIKMATDRYTEMEAKIFQLLKDILELAAREPPSYNNASGGFPQAASSVLCRVSSSYCGKTGRLMYPSFLQNCVYLPTVKDKVTPLLKNHLILNKSAVPGQTDYKQNNDFRDFFLCFDIKDHELPWDISKKEW